MKKTTVVMIVAIGTLSVSSFIVGICLCCRHVKLEDCHRGPSEKTGRTHNAYFSPLAGHKCSPRFRRPRMNISAVESNSVATIFRDLNKAYTNEEVDVLQQKMAQIPDLMTNVSDSVFIELQRPFLTEFHDRFVFATELQEFDSVQAFERYMTINFLVAKFYGELFKRRGGSSNLLPLEFGPLALLTQYKARFHSEGRGEFEQAADRFLDQLKRSIDSEDGLTRWYMWMQVDLQWPNVDEQGWTAKDVGDFAKNYAGALIKLGHTPKWLHEFDNIQEPEWSKKWDAKYNVRRPKTP